MTFNFIDHSIRRLLLEVLVVKNKLMIEIKLCFVILSHGNRDLSIQIYQSAMGSNNLTQCIEVIGKKYVFCLNDTAAC